MRFQGALAGRSVSPAGGETSVCRGVPLPVPRAIPVRLRSHADPTGVRNEASAVRRFIAAVRVGSSSVGKIRPPAGWAGVDERHQEEP